LNQIKALCGVLQGIPLCLKLETVKVTKGDVYCCHIELRARDLLDVQRKALELAQMRAVLGGKKMLDYSKLISPPAGDNETAEESADVQDEFYYGQSDETIMPDEIILPDTGEVISGDRQKVQASSSDSWGFDEFDYENSAPEQTQERGLPVGD
jgi:hypothetical protein